MHKDCLKEHYLALKSQLVILENEIGDIFKKKEMLEELIKEQDKTEIAKRTEYEKTSEEHDKMEAMFRILGMEELIDCDEKEFYANEKWTD